MSSGMEDANLPDLADRLSFEAAILLAFAADFFAALPPLAPESCL